jgi:hypothetical protein
MLSYKQKNIDYKININSINKEDDKRFDKHWRLLSIDKFYKLLHLLNDKYHPLMQYGTKAFDIPKKNIFLYNKLYPGFVLTSMYLFNDYIGNNNDDKFKEVKFLSVSNTLLFAESLMYYSLLTKKIKKNSLLKYILSDTEENKIYFDGLVDRLNTVYENNNLTFEKEHNKNNNKYNIVAVYLLNSLKTTIEGNSSLFLNIEKNLLECIIKGIQFLENNGDLIICLPSHITDVLKQIIYLLTNCFDKVEYNIKSYFVKNNLTSSFIVFKNFNSNNNILNDLNDILSAWSNDAKSVISIIDTNYNKTFNEFIEKFDNYLFQKKHYKLLLKINKIDLSQLSNEQILNLFEKIFNNSIEYNIYIAEKALLKVKPEFKIKLNSYLNEIEQFNLSYPKPEHYILNDMTSDISTITKPNFTSIKQELQLVKFHIDTRDKEKWANITHIINISRFLNKFIQQKFNLRVSRGFLKMYEIFGLFNIVNINSLTNLKEYNALHICEMPGNFIAATNHFLKQYNKNISYNWFGNSLNPYNEYNRKKYGNIISDDYGYMKKYRNRWLFGKDDTGDITNIDNIKFFENKFNETLDFLSSDCGLGSDSQESSLDQEKRLSILTICEFFISLLVLKIGGSAVFKIFLPVSEENSISYIYLLSKYFEQLVFIKQASGSLGSSEIYILAKNKKYKLEKSDKDMIYNHIKNFDNSPLDLYVTDTFKTQLYGITKLFIKNQIDYIYRSFYYYDHEGLIDKKYFDKLKNQYCEQWIKLLNFQKHNNIL